MQSARDSLYVAQAHKSKSKGGEQTSQANGKEKRAGRAYLPQETFSVKT
jgi:hypothetical protein